MGTRRRARELALQMLYQMEVNPVDPHEALELFWRNVAASEAVKEFVGRIVEGVHGNWKEIDKLIARHSEHWRLDRMDWVDKSILRMGVFELLFCDDIPPKVAMNEAVDLGKKFGAEESGAFINGILDKISKTEARV
ncbi:MAG: transcription antitermination factor NusB [Deltaproteobacteria bacterium RBG_13_52_11]|nr:MAG: transcription antitermination factor NusB [Deltaproteobacteria bacterium RBG_13_52_11]